MLSPALTCAVIVSMRNALLSGITLLASGFTFRTAVQSLSPHPAVVAAHHHAQAAQHTGTQQRAWHEPVVKLSAKNLPPAWSTGNTTPRRGFEISIMQKIPLTARQQNLAQAWAATAQERQAQAQHQQRKLLRALWEVLITVRKLRAEHKILQENYLWLHKTRKIAEQLYANGKSTRRAVLDIQIREAEVRTALSDTEHARQEQQAKQQYLTQRRIPIDPTSIPWQVLDDIDTDDDSHDYREQALQHAVHATRITTQAHHAARIPDLTLAAAYRPNLDGYGNLFTFSISWPLPVTASRRAAYAASLQAQQQATLQLATYRDFKSSELHLLQRRKAKTSTELRILRQETQNFARDSRRLALISYRHGDATYAELLQAELQLQNILIKQATLQAQLATIHLQHRYLQGAALHE